MAVLNKAYDDITGFFKFGEFRKALASIDIKKIVDLLEGWGKKYFGNRSKDYLDEIRRFLAKIVQEIGQRLK